MIRRFSINFAIFSMIIDMSIVVLSLHLASLIRPFLNNLSFIKELTGPIHIPVALFVIFPLMGVVILIAFSLYDGRKQLRIVDEFASITLASLVLGVSLAGVLYISFRDISRALFGSFILLSFLGFLCWRLIARLYFQIRKDAPDIERKILLIGSGLLADEIREKFISLALNNFEIIEILDHVSLLGSPRDDPNGRIQSIVSEKKISDVILAIPNTLYPQAPDIISHFDHLPVRIWMTLGIEDLTVYNARVYDLAGFPFLDLRAPALGEYQALLKRGFDLLVGGVAVLVLLPLILIVALVVLVIDGWPVILKMPRVGENGRRFLMYKFRTMVRDADKLLQEVVREDENGRSLYKTKDDPRITPLGRWLRRTSLDELPQLFNVLQGTMSLVGPRPEIPELVDRYQPWQRKRFAIPPGITGWWQVQGRSDKMMHLHTEDDLYYIKNYSLWMDIQILVRTIWVVMLGRGAY